MYCLFLNKTLPCFAPTSLPRKRPCSEKYDKFMQFSEQKTTSHELISEVLKSIYHLKYEQENKL